MTPPTVSSRPRAGFALIVVLWVIASGALISMLIGMSARSASMGARNRASLESAFWTASGCAEIARWLIDREFRRGAGLEDSRLLWATLERAIDLTSPLLDASCTLRLEAGNARVPLDRLDLSGLAAMLSAARIAAAPDDLFDALRDWSDRDTVPRPRGAERSWYLQNGRVPPRDSLFATSDEVRIVRGFEEIGDRVAAWLTAEDEPVALNVAPLPVLVALPGFSTPLAEAVFALREARRFPATHQELLNALDSRSAELLLQSYTTVVEHSEMDPNYWLLRVSAAAGLPPMVSTVELRLVRSSAGVVATERRVW